MKQHHLKGLRQVFDAALVFFAAAGAHWGRYGSPLLPDNYLPPAILLALATVMGLQSTSHYLNSSTNSISRQIRSIALGSGIGALLTSMLFFMTQTGDEYSRIWFGYTVFLSALLILVSKFFFNELLRTSNQALNVVLIGRNDRAKGAILNGLNESHECNISAHYQDFNHRLDDDSGANESVFKFIESQRVNSKKTVSEIWLAHEIYSQYDYYELDSLFGDSAVTLVFLPDIPTALATAEPQLTFLGGISIVGSNTAESKRLDSLWKFLTDKLIAAIGLVFLSPLFVILAIVIKLDSKGPVFYKQKRYGLSGREFSIFKFRTMTTTESTEDFVQVTKNDRRITKVGRILRKTSLDELPQLVNVLLGSMSIVGPRPHPNVLNEDFRAVVDGYMSRHKVKPGITGLAQINGYRGETASDIDMEGRINYDLEYIRNWSLMLDIEIILKTVLLVFRDKNAY